MYKLIIEDSKGRETVSYFPDRETAVQIGEREASLCNGQFWVIYEN